MIRIHPSHYFRLANGQIIKSIHELPDVLRFVSEPVFRSHVTSYRNDFAAWIADVYRLENLSDEVARTKEREEIARIINAYIQTMADKKVNYAWKGPGHSPSKAGGHSEKKQSVPHDAQDTSDKGVTKPEENPHSGKSGAKPVQENPPSDKGDTSANPPSSEKDDAPGSDKKTSGTQSQDSAKESADEKKSDKQDAAKEDKKETRQISDADDFFEKNPMIIDQVVDKRKKQVEVSPLRKISYDQTEGVQSLKDAYSRCYNRLVELRKGGFDMKLADVMLQRIPAKIKLYEASQEKKDKITVTRYLNEVIEELNNYKDQ